MSTIDSPGRGISPSKARKCLKKARKYLRAGQRDRARMELRGALEHLPEAESPSPGVRDLILDGAEIASSLDGSAKLVALLRQQLESRPRDVESWVALIRLLRASRKLPEAVSACEEADISLGGSEELQLLRAELLVEGGSEEEGLGALWTIAREGNQWRQALALIEGSKGSSAELRLIEASRLRRRGETEDALRALDVALGEDPRSVAALRAKAQIHVEQEEWEQARDSTASALDLESTHADLWDLKALAEERLAEREEAIRSLQVSLRYAPDRVDVIAHLGHLLLEAERYEHAQEVFEEASGLAPKNIDVLEGQRACAAGLRRWNDYREICGQIASLDPTREDVLLDEAWSWIRSGGKEEALKILQNILERDGTSLEVARKAASLTLEIEAWDTCLEASKRILSKAPKDDIGLRCKGLSLHGLGRGEEALGPLSSAAKLHGDLRALRTRKDILKSMGRWKGVYQACKQLVEHEPQDVGTYLEMGSSAEAMGKLKVALQAYDNGLKQLPANLSLLLGKGALLSRESRHGEALHVYEEALESDQESFEAQQGIALSLHHLRSHEEAVAAFDDAIGLREDPEAWYFKGLSLMELGRLDQAVGCFDKAGELKEEGRIWMAKGNALLSGGKPQEALYSFDKALRVEPTADEARLMRAACYMELGDYRMALQGLEEALPRRVDDWRFLEARVQCLKELGRPKEAYDVAVELSEVHGKDPRAWTLRASMARTLGLGTEALECLERACKLNPNDPAPKLEEARLLLSLEDYPESLRVADEVIRRDRENSEAYIVKGESFAGLGRHEDALRAFNESLHLDPENRDGLVGRALNLARLRRFEDALATVEGLIDRSPSDPWAHYWRARVLWEARRWDEALTNLNQALYFGGSHPTILAQKGLTLLKLQRADEGHRIVGDALSSHPNDPALTAAKVALLKALDKHEEALDFIDASLLEKREDRELLFQKVEALEALGRWAEAVESLEHAARLSPDSKDVWTRCSGLYLKLGQPESSLAAYDKAIELDPGDVELWKGRGRLCETLRRWEDAIQSYVVAVDIRPKDEGLLCALGRSYVEMGLYERANEAYQRALNLNPTMEEALVGQKSLGERRREEKVKTLSWNVLDFEVVNARPATKEEAFKYCNVPMEYLDEVLRYVNEPPEVDVLSLPDTELRNLEAFSRDVLSTARGSHNRLPRLSEVVSGLPHLDLNDSRQVLGYVRGVQHLNVPEEELPGMDDLMKVAMDLPRREWNMISLARNLGLGAYEAKRLEQSLRVFETRTSEEEEEAETPSPRPARGRTEKMCIKHGAPGIYQHICGQYLCSACIVGGRCPVCRNPVSRAYRDLQTTGQEDEVW